MSDLFVIELKRKPSVYVGTAHRFEGDTDTININFNNEGLIILELGNTPKKQLKAINSLEKMGKELIEMARTKRPLLEVKCELDKKNTKNHSIT